MMKASMFYNADDVSELIGIVFKGVDTVLRLIKYNIRG